MTSDVQPPRPARTGAMPKFDAPYATADEALAVRLIGDPARSAAAEKRIDTRATRLIEGIRAHVGGLGGSGNLLLPGG